MQYDMSIIELIVHNVKCNNLMNIWHLTYGNGTKTHSDSDTGMEHAMLMLLRLFIESLVSSDDYDYEYDNNLD